MNNHSKQVAIALLATTMISAPAAAGSGNSQQPSKQQVQAQNSHAKPQNQAKAQNKQQAAEKAGADQKISPDNLSRSDIRQIQQALNKDGFNVGRIDGRWGPETRGALKKFQHSKNVNASGELDHQTVADLGLDPSQFSQTSGPTSSQSARHANNASGMSHGQSSQTTGQGH